MQGLNIFSSFFHYVIIIICSHFLLNSMLFPNHQTWSRVRIFTHIQPNSFLYSEKCCILFNSWIWIKRCRHTLLHEGALELLHEFNCMIQYVLFHSFYIFSIILQCKNVWLVWTVKGLDIYSFNGFSYYFLHCRTKLWNNTYWIM